MMTVNPNPARITAASWWFVEQLLVLEPGTENGGTFTDKPGYHNTRDNLLAQGLRGDYSIQLAADKLGPGDRTAAYDWTFPSAQRGDYSRIMTYMDRVEIAYRARDPRLSGWREVLGQADPDLYAEGFDFAGWYTRTPDSSHLWHMHLSELRQHTESYDNKKAMLSILGGQSLADWVGGNALSLSDTDAAALAWRIEAVINNRPTVIGGPTKGEVNKLAVGLAAIQAALAAVQAVPISEAQFAELKATLGAPTAQQIEDAAYRGAQRAEDS